MSMKVRAINTNGRRLCGSRGIVAKIFTGSAKIHKNSTIKNGGSEGGNENSV